MKMLKKFMGGGMNKKYQEGGVPRKKKTLPQEGAEMPKTNPRKEPGTVQADFMRPRKPQEGVETIRRKPQEGVTQADFPRKGKMKKMRKLKMMTFQEAFEKAKKEGKKTFMFKGQKYATKIDKKQDTVQGKEAMYDPAKNTPKEGGTTPEPKDSRPKPDKMPKPVEPDTPNGKMKSTLTDTEDKDSPKAAMGMMTKKYEEGGVPKKEDEEEKSSSEEGTKSESSNESSNESSENKEKDEGSGNYRDKSDTPQVVRDKDIDRGRNKSTKSEESSDGDAEGQTTTRKRLTRDERFKLRQQRKQDRMERRNARRQARLERRGARKEARQYRRTMRRKAAQERRKARGLKFTGGRAISPRRFYKNLLDKIGAEPVLGRGRLKDFDEFRGSRTTPPVVREYNVGGITQHGKDMDMSAADRAYYNRQQRKMERKRDKAFKASMEGDSEKATRKNRKYRKAAVNKATTFNESRNMKDGGMSKRYMGGGMNKEYMGGGMSKRYMGGGSLDHKVGMAKIRAKMEKGGMSKSYEDGGKMLKPVPANNKGLKKLPKKVRNKMGFMQDGGKISTGKVDKFLDDKFNRKSTRSGMASRPGEARGMSKEMAKYMKDMAEREAQASKIKGKKKPSKTQMKRLLKSTSGRAALRRMGYLGLALSLYDVSKRVAPATKPALKKRAKSGNPNMGRKI